MKDFFKNKRNRKIFAWTAGIILGLFLLVNLGLNIWIQHFLPDYIKKNTKYRVEYKDLSVEIFSGHIHATGIQVASKNPNDANTIGLDGTVQELNISRLGLWDALFNKRISSNDLKLVRPQLKITLAKPIDDRTGQKRNPVEFSNINIEQGNIDIYRHTKQRFVAVQDLYLSVSNLQLTEEDVKDKLPVVFDEYSIRGKNFYFRPNDLYELKIKNITTKDGQMTVQQFSFKPLMAYARFTSQFSKHTALYDMEIREVNFKDIKLDGKRISLSQAKFSDPKINIYNTSAPKSKDKKPFTYEVNLEDVQFSNANIHVYKPDGTPAFAAATLNMDVDKLFVDEETAKSNVPFSYDKFSVSGRDILFSNDAQVITVGNFTVNQSLLDVRNTVVKPLTSQPAKTTADLAIANVQMRLNSWKYEKGKLHLDAETALVSGLQGMVYTVPSPKNAPKNTFTGIDLPLKVKTLQVNAPSIGISSNGSSQVFENLVFKVSGIEMNEESVKNSFPLKSGNFSLTSSNFKRKVNQFYTMSAGLIKVNKNTLVINNFSMDPLVSRAQFIRMIPTERDLYDLKASQIKMTGNWDLVSAKKYLNADQLDINGVQANIFRSKLPADDRTAKPMYSELLRKIGFPMVIKNTNITNAYLTYEEDTKSSNGAGKLIFNNLNMNIRNLNSGKGSGGSTQVPIAIKAKFMNASDLNVNWTFNTAAMDDAFTIAGTINDLPATRINPFIEPYLKVRATGYISNIRFDFRGNRNGINGKFFMQHKDLKVSFVNSQGEKKKLLSAVVNALVKTNSGKFPESVVVDGVRRDPTKSFFNLFWQGIQEGLKKTLIGENIDKTEEAVKSTVQDVKVVAGAAQGKNVPAADTPKPTENATPKGSEKGGLFNKLFKKKNKEEK